MTYKEMLDFIKDSPDCLDCSMYADQNSKACYDCNFAYTALSILCEKAERQKPKAEIIRYFNYEETGIIYSCPFCGHYVGDEIEKNKFCCECGQAIYWEGV